MTDTGCPNQGFPLSQFCLKNNYSLSYHSREVACHAIEKYRDRLNQGESWSFEILKIHTYRALLEKIVCSIEPNLRHSHVNNVKYSEDLSFEAYCTKAISRHHLSIIPEHMLTENKIKPYLDQWRNVIAFYSMRLFFAPLVESVILLDRLLYVQETGSDGDIIAVFDPRISPRNNVLMAKKR